MFDTVSEKVCDDKQIQVCEKIWVEDGYGGKVWTEDPSTCRDVTKTECGDVERQVPRQEKYRTCDWETYQDCYPVPGPDDCRYVSRERCYGRQNYVKGARCYQEPKEACQVSDFGR